MITKQQIETTLLQLKAKKLELTEELKIVDFQLPRYIGMLEILQAQDKEIKTET